jgi:hypothetical protein
VINKLPHLIAALALLTGLMACEEQKQTARNLGAMPKQTLDKTRTDLDKAAAEAGERLKRAEEADSPGKKD